MQRTAPPALNLPAKEIGSATPYTLSRSRKNARPVPRSSSQSRCFQTVQNTASFGSSVPATPGERGRYWSQVTLSAAMFAPLVVPLEVAM